MTLHPQGKLNYVLEPSMEEAEKREIHLQGQASDSSWVEGSARVGPRDTAGFLSRVDK